MWFSWYLFCSLDFLIMFNRGQAMVVFCKIRNKRDKLSVIGLDTVMRKRNWSTWLCILISWKWIYLRSCRKMEFDVSSGSSSALYYRHIACHDAWLNKMIHRFFFPSFWSTTIGLGQNVRIFYGSGAEMLYVD